MSSSSDVSNPASLSRRTLLKVGAGAASASLLTMLDARRAPAQIKGTTLRILQWSHFVPAYDVWFDKFVEEWGNANGVKVRVDRIPHLEIPSRLAAEFAAGRGHDLIYFVGTILTGLYSKGLVDVTDISERIGTKWGGWIPSAVPISVVDGRWYAIPDFYIVAPNRPTTLRFDVVNVFDKIYEIRDGSGIGVFAPQFGPRRAFYFGISQKI